MHVHSFLLVDLNFLGTYIWGTWSREPLAGGWTLGLTTQGIPDSPSRAACHIHLSLHCVFGNKVIRVLHLLIDFGNNPVV